MWKSRNRDHVEAKDEADALRVARVYVNYDPQWTPVYAEEMDPKYSSQQVKDALAARGHRSFRVHYHRYGYFKHANCEYAAKMADEARRKAQKAGVA